jgi:hypothetical protein
MDIDIVLDVSMNPKVSNEINITKKIIINFDIKLIKGSI